MGVGFGSMSAALWTLCLPVGMTVSVQYSDMIFVIGGMFQFIAAFMYTKKRETARRDVSASCGKEFFMKRFLHRRSAVAALVFALVFGAAAILSLIGGRRLGVYFSMDKGMTLDGYAVRFEAEGIVAADGASVSDGCARVRLRSLRAGRTRAEAEVSLRAADGTVSRSVAVLNLRVNRFGVIFDDLAVDSFSGYPLYYLAVSATSGLLSLYFFWIIRKTREANRYSYQRMRDIAALSFLLVVFLLYSGISRYALRHYRQLNAYLLSVTAANVTMAFTAAFTPLAAIFAVLMAASNAVLIQNEGFRPRNALGIALGACLFAAAGGILALYDLGSVRAGTSAAYTVLYSVLSALFAVFASMLVGAMACGFSAARHTPPLDRDFLIILGCRVRADGSLPPLLRGRADRAIEFYRLQRSRTGVPPRLIPSGGRGRDETVSEAEAIGRYLRRKGIPEADILLEDQSENTLENMRFSRRIIEREMTGARTAFCTTNYHVFRSGMIASDAGLDAEGMGSGTKWYFWPNAYMREIAGLFIRQTRAQLIALALMALLAGVSGFLYSQLV